MVDESCWPLVQQVHRPGFVDRDIEHMIQCYERLFMRAARYVILIYSEPGAPTLNVSQRQVLSRWSRERSEFIRRVNLGVAIVLDSALFRATLTAYNWISEPVSPQQAVATRLEGLDWCIDKLSSAGIDVTPQIYDLRATWTSQLAF